MATKNLSILLCLFLAACGSGQESDHPAQYTSDVLISADPTGWDEYIREIGNVVQKDGAYYLYYSGHRGPNYRGKPDIYVGVATSVDGKNWTKLGKVFPDPAEDPHVIVKNGRCYMAYEEKSEVPDRRTSLAESDDCIHFARTVYGILNPTSDYWQNETASSPVLVDLGDQVAIVYEGTGETDGTRTQQGQIGLYRDGAQLADPVFTGFGHEWDAFVASDDIIFHDGWYWMTYHTLDPRRTWTSTIAKSRDLVTWEEIPGGPHFKQSTVMFFRDGGCFKFIASDGNEIYSFTRPEILPCQSTS